MTPEEPIISKKQKSEDASDHPSDDTSDASSQMTEAQPSSSKLSIDSLVLDISSLKIGQEKILALLQPKEVKSVASPCQQKQHDLDFELSKSKNIEELLSNVEWLIQTDDNEYARCLMCTGSDNSFVKGQNGFFSLNQEFRYLKFSVKGRFQDQADD